MKSNAWRFTWGADVSAQGVKFSVWAPSKKEAHVVLPIRKIVEKLHKNKRGWFEGLVPQAGPGDLYWYRFDGGRLVPDPCSRYQPQGPHGPSLVVNPRFPWKDGGWPGLSADNQVLYEVHIGAFTPEGTWEAAARQIPELKKLGVTALEIMPVCDWPGRWNWGYDGVNLFAPARAYGKPKDMKKFVDLSHRAGLGIILDVVYNHMGSDGCYLGQVSPLYFSKRHKTDWGPAYNYDGPGSGPVREYVIQNALYWVKEFHVDGFRFDATQNMYDDSPRHVLADLSERARRAAAPKRLYLVGENEPQERRCLEPPGQGGFGLDALWDDDFHHSLRVAFTNFREAYFTDYLGRPQELVSLAKRGFLYQGQYYRWQKQNRGQPGHKAKPASFIFYTQNHDQVGNQPRAPRIHRLTSPARYRALTAFQFLSPHTPLLFMGQEFGASSPFFYFADNKKDLAEIVWKGRKEFLSQFPSYKKKLSQVPDPASAVTFKRSRLRFSERKTHAALYRFHRDLIRLHKEDAVLSSADGISIDGAVLGDSSFLMRYEAPAGARLLLVNYGPRRLYDPCPEPLLAAPEGRRWRALFSSDHRRYGGGGAKDPRRGPYWDIPAESAFYLSSEKGAEAYD